MANTFFTPVTRTQCTIPTVSSWTTISLDSVVTVPAGALHVVVEMDNASGTSGAYGFTDGDSSSTTTYTATGRMNRQQIIKINSAKTIRLFSGNLATTKFYIRAYTNHIIDVASTDLSSQVTGTSLTTVTCSSLPSDAASGTAVVLVTGTMQLGAMGTAAALPTWYHQKDSVEYLPLNASKQFEVKTGVTGGLVANSLVLIGYMPPGKFIANSSTTTHTNAAAATWEDQPFVDSSGVYSMYRYYDGTSNTFGFDTGNGNVASTAYASYNPVSNPIFVKPNASTGKATFISSSITASKIYYVGTFVGSAGQPDPFTLNPINYAIRSTSFTSNEITLSGTGAGQNVAISVTGGEYAIDTGSGYGAWTNAAGNIQVGNKVKVRVTSSSTYGGTATSTLNIGGVTSTFTVTTETKGYINISGWTQNTTSPKFDGANINGGH